MEGASSKHRRRRSALTSQAIVETAIRIADEEGLEAVSIRRIAAELQARPMSLYNHFASKDELLASLADEVVGEVLVGAELPKEWRAALAMIARHLYGMFIRHPWAINVLGKESKFTPNATKQGQQLALAMGHLPLEETTRWTAAGILNDYVLGHSLRTITAPPAEELGEAIPEEELAAAPELAALPDYLRTRTSVERFEIGLQTVLDGVEARFLTDSRTKDHP